jgi:hypothetical protein
VPCLTGSARLERSLEPANALSQATDGVTQRGDAGRILTGVVLIAKFIGDRTSPKGVQIAIVGHANLLQ